MLYCYSVLLLISALIRSESNKSAMQADTYLLRPPNEQLFYRYLINVMNFYALADRRWWGYGPPNKLLILNRKICLCFAPVALISQIIYLVLYYKILTFSTLGIIFSILPPACITNVCVFSAQQAKYKDLMKNLFHRIHLNNYKDLNSFARSKVIKVEHYTRWTMFFLTVCLVTDCTLWLIMPIRHYYNNIEGVKNQTVMLQTIIYFWSPFDYSYNVRNWAMMHSISSYVGFTAAGIITSYNTINHLFVFHLIGHVQILKHRFRTEFANRLTDEETKQKLIRVINDHSFIIKYVFIILFCIMDSKFIWIGKGLPYFHLINIGFFFVDSVFKDVQDVFGYNVTANYCHNLFSDSLLLYQIMFGEKSDTVLYGLMLVVYMGGLILMSTILEEIRRESDDLPDVIYGIPWESMSISNQKTLMMLLARAQPVFEFVSAGGLRAGVRPMISIIKSTFSYYVMLKTTVKVDT